MTFAFCGAVASSTRLSSPRSVRAKVETSSVVTVGSNSWTSRYSYAMPGEGSLFEEVAEVLLRVRAAFGLVALVVGALHEARHPALSRARARRGRTRTAARAWLRSTSDDRPVLDASVLDTGAQDERVHGRTERVAARAGAEKFRVGPPRQLGESLPEHVVDQPMHQSAAVVGHALSVLAGTLADELHVGPRQFRIGGDADEKLLMQRHRPIGFGRGRRARRQRLEQRAGCPARSAADRYRRPR